jgi:hypothetical protein
MDWEALKVFVPVALATRIAGFEVQRWARARAGGKRGASVGAGLFVDLSDALSSIAYYIWLVVVAFRVGIPEALVLGIAVMIGSMAVGMISGVDAFWKWMLGLILIWPLTIALYVLVFALR